jgi:hypothetical protein
MISKSAATQLSSTMSALAMTRVGDFCRIMYSNESVRWRVFITSEPVSLTIVCASELVR